MRDPWEVLTSFPITSSPAMPILHMNSHSTWGALLRLALHHKQRTPQATQSPTRTPYGVPFCVWLGDIFITKKGTPKKVSDFLQSVFAHHVQLRYARLPHELPPHMGRPPPSSSKISCRPSFPTTSSSALPVFPTDFWSLSCPHRSHSVLRDTVEHYFSRRQKTHLPPLEVFQPLLASRCLLFPIIDMNSHP